MSSESVGLTGRGGGETESFSAGKSRAPGQCLCALQPVAAAPKLWVSGSEGRAEARWGRLWVRSAYLLFLPSALILCKLTEVCVSNF